MTHTFEFVELISTGLGDPPWVVVTAYSLPTSAGTSGAEVKVTTCGRGFTTVKLWGAAGEAT